MPAIASRTATFVAFLLTIGLARVQAQGYWEPLSTPGHDLQASATVHEELITTLHLGPDSVVLQETELAAVRRHLRTGPIGQRREGGSYREWLCLRGGSGENTWVLWLESGPMGAGLIEGFHLVSLPATARTDARCSRLSASIRIVTGPKSIALGARDSTVLHLLGVPSASAGDTLVYRLWRRVADSTSAPGMHPSVLFDLQNTLFLVTKGGRLGQIACWKSITQ